MTVKKIHKTDVAAKLARNIAKYQLNMAYSKSAKQYIWAYSELMNKGKILNGHRHMFPQLQKVPVLKMKHILNKRVRCNSAKDVNKYFVQFTLSLASHAVTVHVSRTVLLVIDAHIFQLPGRIFL